MLSDAYKDFRPGDVVEVTRYMIGRMYPPATPDTEVIGQQGVVTRVWKKYEWGYWCCAVRLFNGKSRSFDDHGHEQVKLVRQGDGTCVPGVTYPFNEDELRQQRWAALLFKLKAADNRTEGYCNPATHLAALLLRNDSSAVRQLEGMRRKDGTVNVNKVRGVFRQCRLELDPWVFAPKLDIPAEFQHWSWRNHAGLDVDWNEVADDFRADGPRRIYGCKARLDRTQP